MKKIIEHFWADEKNFYFSSSDLFSNETGDPYLKYHWFDSSHVGIYLGGNSIEETLLRVCSSEEQLQRLITALI